LAGADSIDGLRGADWVYGGDGNDTILGGAGSDTLYGEGGDDTLTDNQGSNLLDGGAGDDSLTSRSLFGNATLLGGVGDDLLDADGSAVSLSGGGGDDYLTVANGASWQGRSATLDGGDGYDTLIVTNYSQATLNGGDGDDTLRVVATRTAYLNGGGGHDDIKVDYASYSSAFTDGNDRLPKGYVLEGGEDDDLLLVTGEAHTGGGLVTVVMRGGAGDDRLSLIDRFGGNTTDSSWAGVARATLDGGDGADEIGLGGVLQATLTGGAGVDTFKLLAQQYQTVINGPKVIKTDSAPVTVSAEPLLITDFAAGSGGDILDYSDLLKNGATNYDGSNPFSTKYLTLVQSGADTLLKFDSDGSAGATASAITVVILKNATATTLVNANFNPNFVLPSAPDTTPPSIAISSDRSTLAVGQTATLTFAISESVADFVVGDLTVSGGALRNFAGSGTSYSATFTPNANSTANGVVSVGSNKFSDTAGNLNVDGADANNTITISVDTVSPTIAITSNRAALALGQTATLTFAISESVADFVVGDITASGGTLGNFAGNGTSYSATFTPNANSTANGVVSVGSNKFSDTAGNFNVDGADANNTITMTVNTVPPDTTPPTIAISSDRLNLATGQSATLTFLISESVSDFLASDITVTGGTLSNFSGSGTSYSVSFTPPAESLLRR
jgi:hypothetical protein